MHLEYLFVHKCAKIRIQSHISAYAIAYFSISAHFVQHKHTRTRHLRHIFP